LEGAETVKCAATTIIPSKNDDGNPRDERQSPPSMWRGDINCTESTQQQQFYAVDAAHALNNELWVDAAQ